MGGALRDADGGAVEALEILHAGIGPHDKSLAVVEIDRPLPQPERRAAQIGLGRVAIEHVDFARLQGGKAVLRRQRDVSHFCGIAEHAGGQSAAIVDVEPLVIALRVRRREAGKTGADAAHQRAALLDRIQRCGLRRQARRGEQACSDDNPLHTAPPNGPHSSTRCRRPGRACRRSCRYPLMSRYRAAPAAHGRRCGRPRTRPRGNSQGRLRTR